MTIFTMSAGTATIFVQGVPRPVRSGHPNYDRIMEILRSGEEVSDETLLDLIDTRQATARILQTLGRVKIGVEVVYLDDREIHSELARRMISMVQEGFDVAPMAKFMENLYANPSKTAVDELFLWLEQSNLPITPRGNFIAYKKVQDDYTSYHQGPDGPVLNTIGSTVAMLRNEVDDNRNRTCSAGLHFCSYQYLPHYYGNRGKVLVLEIDPADVVSIPSDYDNAKGRTWCYKVIGEVEESQAEFAFPSAVWDDPYHDDWGREYDDFGL